VVDDVKPVKPMLVPVIPALVGALVCVGGVALVL
jgi:hypothetical protein